MLQIHKWHFLASGADRAYFSTCAALEKRGVEVAHFTSAHPKNVFSPWSKYFPKYHDFSHFSLKGLLSAPSFIWNFEAARCLEKLLQDFKPDVAHLHNIYHHLTPSILKVLKKYNIPVVMTVHDFNLLNPNYVCYHNGAICRHAFYGHYLNALFHNCVGESFFKTLLVVIQMLFDKFARRYETDIDAYIFGSNFYRNKFLEAGFNFKRGEVMPHFLLESEYFEATNSSAGNFAFAGRLSEEKGVRVLLDALKLIQTKIWNISFIGSGSLKNEIERPGYKVYDNLSKSERENLLKQQQFIIGPSVCWENMSYGILESYGLHKPIIGTKIGGITEMIEDGITGLLVEPNDPKSLAAAIDTLLQQPHLCQSLGERGFQLAKTKYNEQVFLEKLLSLYGDLI